MLLEHRGVCNILERCLAFHYQDGESSDITYNPTTILTLSKPITFLLVWLNKIHNKITADVGGPSILNSRNNLE